KSIRNSLAVALIPVCSGVGGGPAGWPTTWANAAAFAMPNGGRTNAGSAAATTAISGAGLASDAASRAAAVETAAAELKTTANMRDVIMRRALPPASLPLSDAGLVIFLF